MTRIIAGAARGRRLRTPPGAGTRPTSDRVREALFSRLEHLEVVAGGQVLDLYAGSGALGLEAASRGAASVLLVESDRAAAAALRHNVATLAVPGCEVVADRVDRVLLAGPSGRARRGLALLDPPYDLAEDDLAGVLELLARRRWLAAGAVVVVERAARSPQPRWPLGWQGAGERSYGQTRLWFAGADESDDVA